MWLSFSFLFSMIAFAQSGGTISGSITNPDGQPVAAAPMQFKHVETGRLFNTFTKPWKIRNVWDLAPGEEIQEYICVENNKDVQHLQAK